jgi:hypothetical protein
MIHYELLLKVGTVIQTNVEIDNAGFRPFMMSFNSFNDLCFSYDLQPLYCVSLCRRLLAPKGVAAGHPPESRAGSACSVEATHLDACGQPRPGQPFQFRTVKCLVRHRDMQ